MENPSMESRSPLRLVVVVVALVAAWGASLAWVHQNLEAAKRERAETQVTLAEIKALVEQSNRVMVAKTADDSSVMPSAEPAVDIESATPELAAEPSATRSPRPIFGPPPATPEIAAAPSTTTLAPPNFGSQPVPSPQAQETKGTALPVGVYLIPSFAPKNPRQLIFTSENYKQIVEQWETFWFLDQPEPLTPHRTHGGIL